MPKDAPLDKKTDALKIIASAISFAGIACTVVYIYGFGISYRVNFLPLFGIADLIRLSIQWLGPLAIGLVLTAVLAIPFGKFWWLIDVGILAIFAWVIFKWTFHPDAGTSAAGFPAAALLGGNLLLYGLLFLGVYVYKKGVADAGFKALCMTIGAVVIFAGSRGLAAGFVAAHPSQSRERIFAEGDSAGTVGNTIWILGDSIAFRASSDGRLIVLPMSRVKSLEIDQSN